MLEIADPWAVAGDDLPLRAEHVEPVHIDRVGKAKKSGLEPGLSRSRNESRLADGQEHPRPRRGGALVVREGASQPHRHGFVHGDRDDHGKGGEQGQIAAGDGLGRFLHEEQDCDDREQDEAAGHRRREGPAGDGGTEEDARREHGVRRKDNGQGHERDPDPGVRLAHPGQKTQARAEATRQQGDQRRSQLPTPDTTGLRPTKRLHHPPDPDHQCGQSDNDPGDAEDCARHRAQGEVWWAEGDGSAGIDHAGQGEQDVDCVADNDDDDLAVGRQTS